MKKITVLLLILLLPTSVLAQASFKLGPRGGYYKSLDADDGKMFFGGAARLMLAPAIGVEASIDYRQEEYRNGVATVKSWPVMVTGLIYPLPVVYGLIGAGWYNSKVSYDIQVLEITIEEETTQDFGWHFGLGADIPLSYSVSLVGDVRYVYLNYDFEHLPGSEKIDVDFYAITVGLLFEL